MDPLPVANDPTPLSTAIFGASIAGVVQTVSTYPLEYFKTIKQIENKSVLIREGIVPHDSIRPLFKGCLPLSIGMATKGATRMFLFNSFNRFMSENRGVNSAPQVVVAALMTGMIESIVSIPFENIKVRMIENSMVANGYKTILDEEEKVMKTEGTDKGVKGPQTVKGVRLQARPKVEAELHPRIKAAMYYHQHPSYNFKGIIKEMYETGGLLAFTQGSSMTIARQCMNSMVWYSTYSSLQQLIDPNRDSITELELLGMGFVSSLALVGVTQPMDVLKTRMQTKDYRVLYKDMMTCVALIFFKEGPAKLWAGGIPRFIKVSCSSTVTLMTYQWVTKMVNKLSESKPFSA
ncbi:hypothetical protein CAS74_003732 [Pichia kudriavzevii]|uniref:Uncharacterized protein n=1 Tax=Pichia kudriavzevii TaxID=4909 RepID=A0A099P2J8_PICKU|nr:hypothetical protein JL09_g2352 [Pichia kudriavzevii]OUT21611.1 hypothetical protein CAS74_003732 [Pichia kudriavzevii]